MNSPIKLTILDIFPSFNELNPNQEEMFAIFQGLNSFFDLQEILVNHKIIEFETNNQSSILISLIKSNNIIASGFLNIKQGEQWITLNYENKNKKNASNLAFNLMDCIKIKIFCETKNRNQINTTFSNTNINNSSLSIIANTNYTNRNNNNKVKLAMNQINLKISKRNINNKMLLKGSPLKSNCNKNSKRRSPNKDINDLNNIQNLNNEDLISNNLIKNNNFNTFNYMNVNINMNPYTTISKCNIKKIDLNSSNKTRNSKIAKKKNINSDYTSLRASNNNFGIKKMNTSTISLNTVNKNKNKKSRLTPDLEIKGIKGPKIGGSPSPNLKHKKKIDNCLYDKKNNIDKSNDIHYERKLKNFKIKDFNTKNYNEEANVFIHNKGKRKETNYSNIFLNDNFQSENYNNNFNKHENNNFGNNKFKLINDPNYNSTFNNTFNNINKQVIKNKLLYINKQTNNINENINNKKSNNSNNNSSSNIIKNNNDRENSVNSFDEEEKNKTKDNSKIYNKEKVGIYTTKRINIKRNTNDNMNARFDNKDNKNTNSQKNIIKIDELIEDTVKNKKIKEREEIKRLNDNEEKAIDINNDINNIEDDNDYDYEDFKRMKEDFILLYNDDYANNVQDDLLKLEIELFIEKMADLISCYHLQLEEKRMENELIRNDYNLNAYEFKKINKLIKKLELCKINCEINKINSKKNQESLKKQDKINLIVNKTEIELFRNIFHQNNYEKKKKNELKSIIVNILKRNGNKNIISDNAKFNQWINIFNNKKEKNIIRKNNKNHLHLQTNAYIKESSFVNNLSNNDKKNIFLKNNNSYYNLDNTYKKKMPISPIYPKNNRFIPPSEN